MVVVYYVEGSGFESVPRETIPLVYQRVDSYFKIIDLYYCYTVLLDIVPDA